MNLSDIFNKSLKQVKSNSPAILTGLGVAGVITTAYLTARASFKAARIIDSESTTPEGWEPKSVNEQMKLTWKYYIPPTIAGTATVACIIGASKAGGRRTAAAVTAYSLTERAFSEYKEHVVEQLGKGKEQKIRDEIAQKHVTNNPPDPNKELVVIGRGQVLCCELWTGRYFKCDMETLRKAENDLNHMVINGYGSSLSDFYDLIDLDHTSESNYLGWDTDKLLELEFSTTLSPAGEPCITFDYKHIRPNEGKTMR